MRIADCGLKRVRIILSLVPRPPPNLFIHALVVWRRPRFFTHDEVPMQKLIVLYTQPDDVEAFEAAYTAHLQLVQAIPGLAQTRLSRFNRTLQGDGFYLMAEMLFADKDTLKAAMRSGEMAAVGQDAQQFANLKVMMLGEE